MNRRLPVLLRAPRRVFRQVNPPSGLAPPPQAPVLLLRGRPQRVRALALRAPGERGLPARHRLLGPEGRVQPRQRAALGALQEAAQERRSGPELEADAFDLLDETAATPYLMSEELNFRIALWQGDVTSLKVDAVVKCIQETKNPQTRNAALLVLGALVDLFPQEVLRSLLPVFRCIGQSDMMQREARPHAA